MYAIRSYYAQAQLTAGFTWGKNNISIYEAFPFWSEDEKKEAQVQKYKDIMMRYAHQ